MYRFVPVIIIPQYALIVDELAAWEEGIVSLTCELIEQKCHNAIMLAGQEIETKPNDST